MVSESSPRQLCPEVKAESPCFPRTVGTEAVWINSLLSFFLFLLFQLFFFASYCFSDDTSRLTSPSSQAFMLFFYFWFSSRFVKVFALLFFSSNFSPTPTHVHTHARAHRDTRTCTRTQAFLQCPQHAQMNCGLIAPGSTVARLILTGQVQPLWEASYRNPMKMAGSYIALVSPSFLHGPTVLE